MLSEYLNFIPATSDWCQVVQSLMNAWMTLWISPAFQRHPSQNQTADAQQFFHFQAALADYYWAFYDSILLFLNRQAMAGFPELPFCRILIKEFFNQIHTFGCCRWNAICQIGRIHG